LPTYSGIPERSGSPNPALAGHASADAIAPCAFRAESAIRSLNVTRRDGYHHPPATLVPITPVFINTKRLASAGFLAGYTHHRLSTRLNIPRTASTGTVSLSAREPVAPGVGIRADSAQILAVSGLQSE
jgi:hypothetical protein